MKVVLNIIRVDKYFPPVTVTASSFIMQTAEGESTAIFKKWKKLNTQYSHWGHGFSKLNTEHIFQ